MDDLISRQAAISAICNACGKIDCDKMDKCEKLQLPPANCSEFPNSSDTISRQQAIEALDKRFDSIPMEQTSEILMLRKDLRNLPPAQPEQLGTNLAEVGTGCISREQAIDALKGCYCGGEDLCGEPWIYENQAVKAIEQLPSAQPKRGKWIDRGEHESGGRYWHEWECNICHHYFDERTFFCPHCGCDMRGEQYG